MDSNSPPPTKDAPESSASANSHKDEGFLKAAWHRLTHQHDSLPPEQATPDPKPAVKAHEEGPKKVSGSSSG